MNTMDSKKEIVRARIVFSTDVFHSATEDTPLFILARRNEKGTIVRESQWRKDEYLVQPDGHNAFYALQSEFQII